MSVPPTTNLLHPHQRTRLMRSTRKLGAVLGTTPHLLESEPPVTILGRSTSRALKRQGSIFTHKQISSLSIASSSTSSSHYPSSSVSSVVSISPGSTESHPATPPGLPAPRDRRSHPTPRLYLQLDPVPLSPTNERFGSSLCPPPSPSPLTPTTPVLDVAEIRRKRMAKLARHLGENVPLELVFSPEPPAPSPDRPPRRRAQSVHVLPDDVVRACPHRNTHSQSHPKQDWVGEWNRPNIRVVQRELRSLRTR